MGRVRDAPPPALEGKTEALKGLITSAFEDNTFTNQAVTLAGCFIGLQVSYLTWGILQEKVMTQAYGSDEAHMEFFKSSAFLVWSNRLLALLLSCSIVFNPFGDPSRRTLGAPILEYAPSSLSNILSSWGQYEALKHVSFPTQVISKSSKIIPVMLVGKLLHRKAYPWREYVEAALITMGVVIFSLNSKKPKDGQGGSDSFEGFLLLAMYLTCDSFTSQWQDKVFKKHHVSQFQMMLGINCCSIIFTSMSLLQSGQGLASWGFITRHPEITGDILILSLCSAVGQVFIFLTIKKFGPVAFTIIMTIRQMLSMTISCFLFGHPIDKAGLGGAAVCFGTLAVRIYRNWLTKRVHGAGTG